jgi:hypothetical protein
VEERRLARARQPDDAHLQGHYEASCFWSETRARC